MRVIEPTFDQTEFHVSRCRRGYRSVAALAKDVELSRGYVAQIARGLVPPPATRAKLAAALSVPEELIWPPAGSRR